ncbi:protease 1 [Opitutia bacterium]|nr:protease 1 [Opitutae bacterium]
MYSRLLSAFVAAGLALSLLDAQPAPAGAATSTNPNVTSTNNGTNTSRRPADKTTRAERDRAADESGVERVDFDRACGNHKHLYFDRSNRAHFICLGAQAQVGPDTTPYTATANQPLANTFLLHSRPGAAKVIYLDFDGHTTTGTSWNSAYAAGAPIVTPAFDTDGNPAAFSDAERTVIQDVWRRVAEDYAAWDVDVTTEDPGVEKLRRTASSDAAHGVRCVIGGSSTQWLGASAGGVAYVGSFGGIVSATTTINDVPAFVFSQQLSNSGRYIAEAASHEVGHTLGLYHSGQTTGVEYYAGHADWAPIMGVGYYKNVVQWTRGDYPLSNNTQDQVALISGRIPRVADEHGSSATTAAVVAGADFTAGGIIADRADQDWFRITAGAGTVNVSGLVAQPSPNLNLSLSLVDANGLVLAQGTAAGLGANLSVPVTGGTYYIVVDGKGSTNDPLTGYTDYASLGRFSLSGSWPAAVVVNQPPVASTAGTSPAPSATGGISGTAPFTVNFVGNNSSDPDGLIASYLWDFGDGTTSILSNVTKTYQAAGNYTAKLTVTDNAGATATATLLIAVGATPPPTTLKSVNVSAITMAWVKSTSISGYITGTVTILDQAGKPAPNANVTIEATGLFAGTVTARTNSRGQVTLNTPRFSSTTKGTQTYTVTNVVLTGYVYDPAKNKVSSATLTR